MKVSRGWMLVGVALFLLGAGPVSAEERVALRNLVPPGPNGPDEPFIKEFSLSKAVQFLDSAALTWQKEQSCFACHSNYAFLLARPAISHKVPAYTRIREAAEYLATHPRETGYQAMEAVMVASVLAQNDAATLGYTAYPGKHHFGPELQLGHVIGDFLDNQVLLIKTAWGGKSLYQDFRPPSSGGEVGTCYTKMLEEIRESLANMKKHFPEYDGRGYEIAGFVWFQGWNDMINNAAVLEYEENLANLIKDVRKELRVPNLPAVIGETGNCDNIPFRKAQAAVAQRAEFKGIVAFVETVQFRRPANESPNVGHGHHWYGNAESYFLIGNALGEAMEKLLKAACTDEKPDPPKPQARTVRNIEGWIVRVDERLLVPPNEELGLRALKLLEGKLADIKYVMAEEPLAKLQTVPIVLDLTHGKLRVMQYHPDADWLEANGYSTDLVKCVHIPEAADLLTPRNIKEQPWVVLHELAHAYHDRVLGFDEPRIREAYERFKRSGHGDSVLAYDGKRVRHYALTDHKEFFAEMTEAYFGTNDFFPFNRAELMTVEPEIFELLRTIWEPVQPAGAVVHPKSPKDTDRSR